jgi:hypothetical protein
MEVISESIPLVEESEIISGNVIPTVEMTTTQSMEINSADSMAAKKICQSSASQQSNDDHRKRDLSTVEEQIVQSVARGAFGSTSTSMDIETTNDLEIATKNRNVTVNVEINNSGIKSKEERLNSRECIEKLLTQNFDRVSTPCVITITKYILNILSDPSEPKYRSINTNNKAFQDKVLKAVGADELMQCFGFTQVTGSTTLRTEVHIYKYIHIYM